MVEVEVSVNGNQHYLLPPTTTMRCDATILSTETRLVFAQRQARGESQEEDMRKGAIASAFDLI